MWNTCDGQIIILYFMLHTNLNQFHLCIYPLVYAMSASHILLFTTHSPPLWLANGISVIAQFSHFLHNLLHYTNIC